MGEMETTMTGTELAKRSVQSVVRATDLDLMRMARRGAVDDAD